MGGCVAWLRDHELQARQQARELALCTRCRSAPAQDVLERFGERAGLGALGGLARQRSAQEATHVGGDGALARVQHAQVAAADAQQDLEVGAAAEERLADEHLGEHGAEGEDVRSWASTVKPDTCSGDM